MPFKHGGHLTKDLYGSLASVVAGRVRWLLLDRYLTDRVAGTINGTDAEPGPGTRTLTDTGSAATITSGEYKVTAIAGARDPWLRYTTGWARAAGTALRIDASASGLAADNWLVGFANTLTTPGIAQTLGVVFGATTLKAQPANMQVDAYTAGTDTNIFVILRSTGFYLMINGNLYHIYRSGTTATLYPHIAGLVADASVDCRVDDLGIVELPLTNPSLYPTPKLSDTFDTPVIIDYGDLGLNAVPVNVTLDGTAGKYNEANSSLNIFSAGYTSLFDPDAGTLICRVKPPGTGVAYVFDSRVDASNYMSVYLSTTSIFFSRVGGGTASTDSAAGVTGGSYHTVGSTWDKAGDAVTAYVDGSGSGSPTSGLGVWVGTVLNGRLGSTYSGAVPLNGSMQDAILADVVATPAQMSTIHTALAAGTLTKATLDGIFGASHYVWYKQNETYQSNGLAHVEADGNGAGLTWGQAGLAWNAAQKTYIQPTPGAELLTNGDFAAWTGDNPDGWTVSGEVGSDPEISEVGSTELHGGTGTGSANFYTTGALVQIQQNSVLTPGNVFKWAVDLSAIASGQAQAYDTSGYVFMNAAIADFTGTFLAAGTGIIIKTRVSPSDFTLDSVSLKPLAFADCLRHIDPAAGELLISAKLTITQYTQSGFVINLDSGSNPQNCLLIYCDRNENKIFARPMASGSWGAASLAGVAFTYSAGTYLEVRRIGTSLYCWYNGAYIGSWTTAVPSTNTKIALFATDSASYFENITVYPTTGYNYGAYA